MSLLCSIIISLSSLFHLRYPSFCHFEWRIQDRLMIGPWKSVSFCKLKNLEREREIKGLINCRIEISENNRWRQLILLIRLLEIRSLSLSLSLSKPCIEVTSWEKLAGKCGSFTEHLTYKKRDPLPRGRSAIRFPFVRQSLASLTLSTLSHPVVSLSRLVRIAKGDVLSRLHPTQREIHYTAVRA